MVRKSDIRVYKRRVSSKDLIVIAEVGYLVESVKLVTKRLVERGIYRESNISGLGSFSKVYHDGEFMRLNSSSPCKFHQSYLASRIPKDTPTCTSERLD
ncbi:hypothetical protein CDL15_Pgr022155 [Punica granatum]|uniref:Uncharacterized protein n=1 Tax=Punica granatum TaxID=22663 RepID=A0A218VTJ6_PUNGR|nr:hypothetical protein CDL15_Pgr022155 [Punica granatum]